MGKAFAALGIAVLYVCLCSLQSASGFGIHGGGLKMASKKVSVGTGTVTVERILCLKNNGKCSLKFLQCPAQCPQRKPVDASAKACFADCGPKCETVCKNRVPKCNGYGSICYDPRFIGGDGTMFYFHGSINHTYALLSDPSLSINARLIGTRPTHRPRDFTWIHSLSLLPPSLPSLTISATPAATWLPSADHLSFSFNNAPLSLPASPTAVWHSPDGSLRIERTTPVNGAVIYFSDKAEITVTAVPITAEDDRVHGYGIPADDCFVHLDVQFKFGELADDVEGILGKTYRPGYVSPVKVGVPMPVMGGEDRYRTTSLFSADCAVCRKFSSGKEGMTWQEKKEAKGVWECSSRFGSGSGIICRR